MPFEPLRTDEKLTEKAVKTKSMDDLMLGGCTGFVGVSVGTFLLAMWPFLVFGTSPEYQDLLLAFPIGLIPAMVLGAYTSKRFGLAAACGFIGGAMAIAVFMHLIANRTVLALFAQSGNRSVPPFVLVYLIPVAWTLAAVAVAYAFIPKSELADWLQKKP
jgi:hypothetical protein